MSAAVVSESQSPVVSSLPVFDASTVVDSDRRFLQCPVPSDAVLRLLGVPVEYRDFIREIDSYDAGNRQVPVKFSLYHFLQTKPIATTSVLSSPTVRAITNVKGVILFQTVVGGMDMVCRSLPFVPEILTSEISTLDIPGEDIRYVHAIEGTLVRLWYDSGADGCGNNWRLSTHRRIDGRKGRWGSISFGEAFDEAFGDAYAFLNRDYVYWFIVSHPKNRLIYPAPKAAVTLVGMWHRPSQSPVPVPVDGIPDSWRQQSFIAKNTAELARVVTETPSDWNHAGVIVTDPTGKWPVKIVTREYLAVKEARGTCPSLRARYLQLTHPGSNEMYSPSAIELFLDTYLDDPDNRELFASVDREIEATCKRLHRLYVDRYINKQITELPKGEFVSLQRLHAWHCEDRVGRSVRLPVVREFVSRMPHYYLSALLGPFRRAAATGFEAAV